jgi:hypothetical protein
MAVKQRFLIDVDGALATDDPVSSLAAAARNGLERGADRREVLEALERRRMGLEAQGRTDDEDAVIEVMERVVGYSSRAARI